MSLFIHVNQQYYFIDPELLFDSDKCDTDFDCNDKSDEYYCDYLRFGENYAKELIPRDESGKALIVYMNVSVLAFPFIETVALKFTADFYLNLKWYDLRIDFRDLNNVTSLNTLSRADQDAIWTPKLGFTNALGPFQVLMINCSQTSPQKRMKETMKARAVH